MTNESADNVLEREELWTPEYKLENAVFKDELAHMKKEDMIIILRAKRDGPGVVATHNGIEGEVWL